jgi:polyferredoxin
VQLFFLALTALVGWEFWRFYREVTAGGVVSASRPGGVEAFLPIAAVMSLKRWVLAGLWDPIHPAGLTFITAVLVGAVVARRAFCSWVCPFGTLSRGLEWVRRRLLRLPERWPGPRWLRLVPLSLKYIILALALGVVGRMSVADIELFMRMPFNQAADASMLVMLLELSTTGFGVVGVLVALSLLVRNGWCRFLCPYGALLGIVGLLSPFRVRRDPSVCTSCRSCTRACPSGIRVSERVSIDSAECTACLSCVAACKVAGALEVEAVGRRRVARPWLVPAAALVVLVAAWGLARATGHWHTSLTVDELRQAYITGPRTHE